jgi:hypothetical protein
MQKLVGPLFFVGYWMYYRWKHGKKSTRPVMRLAGFPVASKLDKPCDPSYCKGNNGGNGFRGIFEQVKEKFF